MSWWKDVLNVASLGTYGAVESIYNDISGKTATREANAMNQQLTEEQNAANLAQWERENEYNLPVNQMQRYKDAGLNPQLIYQQGATSVSAKSPEIQRPNFTPVQGDPSRVLNILTSAQSIANFANNVAKNKAELDLVKSQRDYYVNLAEREKSASLKDIAETVGINFNNKIRSQAEVYIADQFRIQNEKDQAQTTLAIRQAVETDAKAMLHVSNLGLNDINAKKLGEEIKNLRESRKFISHQSYEKFLTNKMRELNINPNDSTLTQILTRAYYNPVYASELLDLLSNPTSAGIASVAGLSELATILGQFLGGAGKGVGALLKGMKSN